MKIEQEVKGVLLYLIKMNKKAFELPGWAYVVALIIGLFVILFAWWLFTKSGQGMVDILRSIKG